LLNELSHRAWRQKLDVARELSHHPCARSFKRADCAVLGRAQSTDRSAARGTSAVAGTIALCLFMLAAVHFYWGLRSMEGHAVLVPELDGRPVYTPRNSDFLDIAAALVLACVIVAVRGKVLHSPMPETWTNLGAFAVGLVLLARAIGDFRYVGFFKRVRDTPFAEWDTRLFSPVSLLLGAATLWVAIS
jgi:hypothetical protein